jgi:hypothetical protein
MSIRMHDGLAVPPPVVVWCELASMLDVDELVQAGDALVRRRAPFVDVWELYAAVAAASQRRGVERLRQALPLIRARTDSPMETSLRLAIMRSGLPEPLVNPPICDERGEFVAFGDLVFAERRIVVEYDGDHHRADRDQYYGDTDRLWRLERLGWRVVRINRTHMFENAREAVSRVRQTLAAY